VEVVITMGMVVVAFFAANADAADVTTIKSTKTNQVRRELRQTLILLLSKPVLENDILCLNPSKPAQLLSERIHKHRTSRGSATIQETNPEDFSRLLGMSDIATEPENKNN
jgi:hypothetical protein